MAALSEAMRTPERPETHRVGDVGQTEAALRFKKWGWTADLVASDYGEDLDCTIFTGGRRTTLHFRCQVKSSSNLDSSVRKLKSGMFSIRIPTTTCTAWLLSYFPVLLAIYDDESESICWTDATSQIRDKVASLANQKLTIHVPRNSLHADREVVMQMVSEFYARLLRLSAPELQCNVYPVLMPGHRVVPVSQLQDVMPKSDDSEFVLDWTSQSLDFVPAWATALNVLDGPYLQGWETTRHGNSLDEFLPALTQLLGTTSYNFEPGEWMTFVTSPVRYRARDDSETTGFWNRELTDWWSYILIDGEIRSDYEHAFSIPNGFLRQIARRTSSWEGQWSVNPVTNVAIQLLAPAPTTPAHRIHARVIREHAIGHFLPWECLKGDVEMLSELLYEAGLVFHEVQGDSLNSPQGVIYGVIADPLFDPWVGLVPQALTWTEFNTGSVRLRLSQSKVFSRLPGKEGLASIADAVVSLFGEQFGNPPLELLTSGLNSVPGLPLDHANRVVVLQRFVHSTQPIMDTLASHFDQAQRELCEHLEKCTSVEVSHSTFPSWRREVTEVTEVTEVSVSWRPALAESSARSYDRNEEHLLQFFNTVLPSSPVDEDGRGRSIDILRFQGELYFEGDDPGGFQPGRNARGGA